MMHEGSFKKLPEQDDVLLDTQPQIPSGMWVSCPKCANVLLNADLGENRICPNCGHHFMLGAMQRLDMLADEGSTELLFEDIIGNDPLAFPGYAEKLDGLREKTKLHEAVICAKASIQGTRVITCVMDGNFRRGSYGHT